MSQPPKRTYSGKSTPHPIRVNDQLWEDFARTALTFGYKPQEAVRWLMEHFVQAHNTRPSDRSASAQADVSEPPDTPQED